MNKLQQAADEHAGNNCTSCNHRGTYGPCVCNKLERAFLAGAEYAAGAFAEWLCKNKWQPLTDNRWSKLEQPIYTTTELYQLWQQSL